MFRFSNNKNSVTTTQLGNRAEQAVKTFLSAKGWEFIDSNWRTKQCEIDLIFESNKTIYFVEVKYRRNSNYGSGLDYVTVQKVEQISFAAELWVLQNNWQGEYNLLAAEVEGEDFLVTSIVEI